MLKQEPGFGWNGTASEKEPEYFILVEIDIWKVEQ
jgi:hypothetical protein